LVTLAWGTVTPALTPELPLELPLELPDDFAPELPEELPLEFPLDLPAEFTAACTPHPTLRVVDDDTIPPTMGANPSAMIANQRTRSIRSLRANGLRSSPVR
jgi:hypothetical protein